VGAYQERQHHGQETGHGALEIEEGKVLEKPSGRADSARPLGFFELE
jgi:hypothetical protein